MRLFLLALLVSCTNELHQDNRDGGRASFDGAVQHSTHPDVAVGSRCSGTLHRERAAPTARVTLRCGRTPIYDGDGQILFDLRDPSTREDDILLFDDPHVDDTPALKLKGENGKRDGEGGTIDVWAERFEIKIAL